MKLFVSYSYTDKDGKIGFGYCAVTAQEPRGLDDVDKIVEEIATQKPQLTAVAVINWRTFAPDQEP